MHQDELIAKPLGAFDERYAELRIVQPRLEQAMVVSMRRFGQVSPVVATECEGAVALVDGFKRLAAARKLSWETLTVRLMPMSSRAAISAVYGLNRGGRGLVDIEEALVVRKLVRELGMTQPEVGELLDRHKSWVSRRLAMVERLCEEVQNDVRVGLVRATVARELIRLPRGNQPEVAASIHQHGLTTRDAGLLITLFTYAADRKEQRVLLEDPHRALQAHRGPNKPPHDARLGTHANQVRRQALRLLEEAAKLDRLTAQSGVAAFSEGERDVLSPLLLRTHRTLARLVEGLAAIVEALRAADVGP